MAEVNQRSWRIPGQKTKRLAWGYSITLNGKRSKAYRSEWTREDAEKALAAVQLNLAPAEQPKPAEGLTFGEAIERYLAAKVGKKTLAEDRSHFERLKVVFGANTPLVEITAAKISAYRDSRFNAKSERTGRPLTAASVNRPSTTS